MTRRPGRNQMPEDPVDPDMGAMLQAVAEVISEEMPEAGFILVLARPSEDDSISSMLSLCNIDQDTTISILEIILERRKELRGESSAPSSPSVQ